MASSGLPVGHSGIERGKCGYSRERISFVSVYFNGI